MHKIRPARNGFVITEGKEGEVDSGLLSHDYLEVINTTTDQLTEPAINTLIQKPHTTY